VPGTRRIGRAAAIALAAMGVMTAPASADHQPGDQLVEVFEGTIDASGQYSASVTDSTGGSWTISAFPSWRVVYPEVQVPIFEDGTFSPQADYNRSAPTAGTVTWSGTSNYDFMGGPDPFVCDAPLQGPQSAGKSFRYRDSVIAHDQQVRFELTALNAFSLFGNGACTPPQASITTVWGVDVLNNTQVFTTISQREFFENTSINKLVERGGSDQLGPCQVQGSCTHDFTWNGTLKLVKVCRNFAGSATTFSGPQGSTTNSFCESECNDVSCGQEDFEVPPLAHPAKEKNGAVAFVASCYGDSPCDGKLTLTTGSGGAAKPVKLGSSALAVEPADHTQVAVKLSRKGKRLLADEGSLKATLKSTLTGDAAEATDSLQVKIKD